MKEKPFRDTQEYFHAFIRTAQYISNRTSRQDILSETGRVLASFYDADLAGFFERGKDGGIEGHHWVLPDDVTSTAILTKDTETIIAGVLETGFLAAQHIGIPEPFATVFLPILWENQTTGVMLVGHRSSDPIPKELLNIYLAIAGLVSNAITGADEEFKNIAARRRAEEALKETRANLAFLVSSTPVVLYRCSASGDFHVIFISDNVRLLMGYEAHEFTEDPAFWPDHIHPDDRKLVFDGMPRLIENGIATSEYRFLAKDGTYRWTHDEVRAVRDADGRLLEFLGYWIDITERKLAEKAVRESESRLNSVIQGSPIPQFVIDKNHRILYWNKALEKASGITGEEVLGTTRQWKAFYDKERPCMADLLLEGLIEKIPLWYGETYARSKLIEGAYEVTDFFPRLGKEGTWLYFTAAPVTDASGNVIGAVETLEDITEWKTAEAEILKAQQDVMEHDRFLQRLIDTIPNPIFYKDKNAAYTGCNIAFEEYIGLSKDELIGKSVYDISPKDLADVYYANDRKLLDNPGTQIYESRVKYADGSLHDVIFTKATFTDLKGDVDGLVGVILDITDRKRTEDALLLQNRIFGTIAEGVYLIKVSDGTIVYTNSKFDKMFGYEKGELNGKHVSVVNAPEEEISSRDTADVIMKTLTEKGEWRGEVKNIRKDGSTFWCLAAVSTFEHPEFGSVWISAHTDITDRKVAEEERERIRSWQAGVNRILESVLAPIPLDQKLKIITDGVVEIFGADFCRIWLIDKGDRCSSGCMHAEIVEGPHTCRFRDKCLHLKASSGRYTHIDGKGHSRVPFGAYKIGRIASGEEPKFLTNDAEHDPRVHDHEWARSLGLVAFSGYRLKPPGGEVMGVFALFARFPISPDMDVILEGLSRAISMEIQKEIADIALRESEEQFRTLIEQSPLSIEVMSPEGWTLQVNNAFEKLWGANLEDLKDYNMLKDEQLISTGIMPYIMRGFSGEEVAFPPVLYDGSKTLGFGEKRWVQGHIYPVRDAAGTIRNVILIHEDITDRRRAEEALRESREMYRELVENINDVIFSIDLKGTLTYISPVVERLYGYTAEDVAGQHFLQFIHPDDRAHTIEGFRRQMGGEYVRDEFRIFAKSGSIHHVSVSPRPIETDGRVIGFNYVMTDITSRKHAEDALRESRQILEAVLNTITVRVFWKDRNLVYLGCNAPFARDAGYEKPDDIIGKDDYAMGWREQAELYRADDRTVIEDGKIKLLFEEPQTTPSGELIHLLTSKVPLRDAGGEIIGVLGTYLDITAHKRAEEAVQAAVKLNQMIDTMSISKCMSYTLDEAERLTSSRIGFFHFVNESEQTIQLVAWSTDTSKHCFISKEPEQHYPVSQAGVWVDCMRERRPVIHNDYSSLPHKKGLPEGHVPVIRELVVPIFDEDKIIAIIGVGNKATDYDERDITILTLLAKNAWTLIRRKRAEDALKESEQKFREIFDNANDAIEIIELLDSGLPGRYLDLNNVACRMVLYSKEELLQLSPLKISTEHFSRPFDEIIREIQTTGHATFESEHRRKDGIIVPVEINSHKITLLGKTVLLSIVRNISERKKAEEALKESEYRFRELFNSMSSGVAVYRAVDDGADFVFVDYNHGAEITDKKTKEEVTGRRVTEVFPGVEEFGLVEVFRRVWRTGQSEHYPLTLYMDEKITGWRENYVYRLPSGEVVAIYDDITDRKQAEEALRASENRYRILFEESPISLWEEDFSELKSWIDTKKEEGVMDLAAWFRDHPEDIAQCVTMVKVIHINRATMALFHSTSFEEFSEGLSTIFPKESLAAFRDEIIALSNGSKEFEKETPLRTLTGERKMIIMKVTIVPGYEETFSKIFVSGIDITQRKNVEEALHQANKKLNMLSSITRHDILNLIMAIRGYLELSEELVENPELKEYMERENEAVDSIQRQIEFTRYYQDIGVEEPKWQDMGKIVRSVLQQLNMAGITLENSISDLEIFADPLIEKVFYNLIENSLRHGEHVTTISFSYSETGTGLIISYRDNGVGITDADKKKLFQKGFGKHTGLGLFLSREILSITGITIQENGEPGKGVNFDISVPEDGYRFRDTP
jgi:PAS domain S-box-containing protein